MENNTQDKGFTLVELLIVIVILGILATVTVFAVRGITDQGQQSACNADKKTMQTAVEAFYAQNGTTADVQEADLVTAGLLVEESGNINIIDGSIGGDPADGNIRLTWADTSTTATPSSECGTVNFDAATNAAVVLT